MKITINGKTFDFPQNSLSLEEVLTGCDIPRTGIAVAVNNSVVRQAAWSETMLRDGDTIIVINAVCGG